MRRRLRTLRNVTFASMMEGLCRETRLRCLCNNAAHCDRCVRGGCASCDLRRAEAHRDFGFSRQRAPSAGGCNWESNQRFHLHGSALVSRRSARACGDCAIPELDGKYGPGCARQYLARNAAQPPEYDRIFRPHESEPTSVPFEKWSESVVGSDFNYEDFLQPSTTGRTRRFLRVTDLALAIAMY
jgi:hypothetical protein